MLSSRPTLEQFPPSLPPPLLHPALRRSGLGKTRLQACRAVLAAIDPTKAPARRCEPDSHLDLARNTRCMRGEEPAIAVATGERRDKCVTGSSLPMDYAVEVFLARQLRLLVERASGQSGEGSPLGCTLGMDHGRCKWFTIGGDNDEHWSVTVATFRDKA